MFLACLILGLSYISTFADADVAFKCAPTQSTVCFLSDIKFLDPEHNLFLEAVDGKRQLSIRKGNIVALQAKHCRALQSFQKITIGPVELRELCIATNFEQVFAENNQIQTLHLEQASAGGESSYHLEVLKLNNNQLKSLDGICSFHSLKVLQLQQNAITTLDMACFSKMSVLEKLSLAGNRLSQITTTSALQLPKLSYIALQNNTLTSLDVEKWNVPALDSLDLASNNLTKVSGLATLRLTEITLAGNRWECSALDNMLAALEENGVIVKDGDTGCTGIRNGSICCTVEDFGSEKTLMSKLAKFTELEQRYQQAEVKFNGLIEEAVNNFKNMVEEFKVGTTTPLPTVKDGLAEQNTELPVEASCVCSADSLSQVESKLGTLEKKIEANNATLMALRDQQSPFSYMTVLAKHEFRTSVARGEQKLKELSLRLEMLREHIKQQQQQP